jgi:hypothetical protein
MTDGISEVLDRIEARRALVVEQAPRTALDYLQSIYRDPLQLTSVRLRAAALAIPFESPKLAVVGHIADDGSFAERLDRALSRSGIKVIEHRPEGDEAQR